jgi:putative ABC transport system permease protein
MFRNYLNAALRNLARNKLYTGINIVGLAVGFAAATLIALFVRDELSFDRFWPEHEHIYALSADFDMSNRGQETFGAVPADIARRLRTKVPAEVRIARLMPDSRTLRRGEQESNEQLHWADPEIFSILRVQALAGDLRQALQHPDGVVLSASTARKYFGRVDPIGETLQLDRTYPLRVAAVIADLPHNSHLTLNAVASGRAKFSRINQADAEPWPPRGFSFDAATYVMLPPEFAVSRVEQEFPTLSRAYFEGASAKAQFGLTLHMVPIGHVHLSLPSLNNIPAGNPKALYALSLIGLLIVTVAAINFVTLMTARASRRAMEIGVRKTSGAQTRDLIKQFIGESVLYALIAAILALALVELLLPAFGSFLQRDIALSYLQDFGFLSSLLGAALLVGALAGVYPALVLTRFRPAGVLKGTTALTGSGSAGVRQVLVIIQFAVLISLMFATVVVYRQVRFALNEGLRLDKDQVLAVVTNCSGPFVTEVRKLPGVRAAVCSASAPFGFSTSSGGALAPNGTEITLSSFAVEPGFFEFYGVRPLAGRLFSKKLTSDVGPKHGNGTFIGPVILNETAVRQLGFASNQAALGQTIRVPPGRFNLPYTSEIVGVVPDFPTSSIHRPIAAAAFHTDAGFFSVVSIRLAGRQIPETLEAISGLWKRVGEPRPIERFFADQFYQDQYMDDIRQGQLIAGFAGIAVFIACLGLFGLSAFTAERRTKEIGVRKAMGASRTDIVRMLVWQFTRPVLWANLIAWPAGYFTMRHWLQGFAYRVELAPWMFLAAGSLAIAIAWLTVSAHALSVARARPMAALRHE